MSVIISRQDVIDEARRWVGTPFHHQASTIGVGCDCIGLIRGIGRNLELAGPTPQEWRTMGGYSRVPSPRIMGAHMMKYMEQTTDPKPGDVAWIAWRKGIPMHVAVISQMGDRTMLIHASEGFGKVVEHEFSQQWRDKVDSYWQLPGVE